MAKATYEIVEHNGGFAYRVGDVYSETFATHRAAHEAAESAAQRQQLGGSDEQILYQDEDGRWREEFAPGDQRPDAGVDDRLPADNEARDARGRILDEDEVPNPDRAPLGDLNHTKPR
ncbi:DUF2188 domain-containing protein [Devosia nitrariae]|uniref:DUF2188 domain-containing protein n=1 Tax=Devosia nitrariae TaxID=2071872 RepID=A0ABQ5W445_9HYPH|nr:hypothetical protein GCM10010862_20060 [Devosia nitrariae]